MCRSKRSAADKFVFSLMNISQSMVKYIFERTLMNMKITNELIANFQNHLYEEEKSRCTIEKYMRDIRFFAEWLEGRYIDKAAVLEYKQALCEKYALTSVNSVLSSLNALFSFMHWDGLKVKMLKLQKQIFADKEKELTKDDYNKLVDAAEKAGNSRLSLIMQTICSSGIRVSELRFITSEALSRGKALIQCKGKLRTVFLPKDLCKMLRKYIKENNIKSGPVFTTRTGKPLNRSNIWKAMKKLCETAGVDRKKVFPHNLRHLFARTYYSMQKDIVRLADILGHSSVNTTRIYTIETGEVHQKQLCELGLLRC